ncbi:MAG TPA: BadF/BadG/BcrA/BcrD ATPase family protein [Gaiellaceae bacterium]|jgi:N-acetylglucosamine kinase-like BadF-type ATPase|nr:BadF/BadG/BcrA/BcrD ATPase family protein [Gaiellaceae bacterium]
MGVIVAVDGGNTKTDVLAATTDGSLLARVRGRGSNSHALGAPGTAAVIGGLLAEARIPLPADEGVFFLCGADLPADIAALEDEVGRAGWTRRALVDNDTFALLHTGTDAADAIAVICGSGINVVGRAGRSRLARYASLGWETGDWGGGEMLGREVLSLAARAADGRGRATDLLRLVEEHFELPIAELGVEIHFGRIPQSRLGELAPLVVAAAAEDAVASSLVARLAAEIVLLVERALRDLAVDSATVVLGGGMLREPSLLRSAVEAGIPRAVRVVAPCEPPVLGAALVALDRAGASADAKARLRLELRDG